MNWQDDPEIVRLSHQNSIRGKLLRSVILWGPFFIASLAGLLFFTFDRAVLGGDHGGTWFLVVVLTILTILFGFQAIQSFLDYIGQPRVETGFVNRRWSRSDSLVIKAHYIRLGKMILRGDQLVLDGIREGDYVEATFYPHSAVLVWVEKKEPPDKADTSSRATASLDR